MVAEKSPDSELNKKYHSHRINTIGGITRPIAVKISQYAFGDKLINVSRNGQDKKFDIFLKSGVNEKTLKHFKDFFKNEFSVYRGEK